MSEESDLTSQLSLYDREELEKTSSSSDSSSELNLQPGALVSEKRKAKIQKQNQPNTHKSQMFANQNKSHKKWTNKHHLQRMYFH